MKFNRQLIPIIGFILAVILFASFLPGGVFGQGEPSPPIVQGTLSPDAVETTQSSAFTYQGNLEKNSQPVNAACSFQFSLWDALNGGAQQGSTQTQNNIPIQVGIFTVQLDFGNQFTGDARWLETAVQCVGDNGFTTLSPRQSLGSTPYAIGLRPGAVIEGETTPFTGVVTGLTSNPDGVGIYGESTEGFGVWGTGAVGLYGNGNTDGIGVFGTSQNGNGVYASSTSADAVQGVSVNANGVSGSSTTKNGVLGQSSANSNTLGEAAGVKGISNGAYAEGVYGRGWSGVIGEGYTGVQGIGLESYGSDTIGVYGYGSSMGVWGRNESSAAGAIGVYGNIGTVYAGSNSAAVFGYNWGTGSSGIGVWGQQDGTGYGVYGYAPQGGYAVVGETLNGGYAGFFKGNVHVVGTLSKGAGSFKIDHPLDPANKYLYHSFVESPDMMNIYNGNVTTDSEGLATVTMPDWFEALNQEFRYQLTVIGQFAQAIVVDEIAGNQFRIQTDKPLVKVSWQVTGIRHDPFAEANRIPVEEEKPDDEKGHYLYPEVYGKDVREGVWYATSPNYRESINNPDTTTLESIHGAGK